MKTIQDILDTELTASAFSDYKNRYTLDITFLEFKTVWDSITVDDIGEYTIPEVSLGFNRFNVDYFNTRIENPTGSDSAQYFYLHIGDVRILQTFNPYMPGMSPMFGSEIESIILQMKTDILDKKLEDFVNNQRIELVLQRIL